MNDAILSVNEFAAEADRFLDGLREGQENLILTKEGKGCAVVQDYERYQAQQKALLMLRLMVQGEADVTKGRLAPQQGVFEELRAGLGAVEERVN